MTGDEQAALRRVAELRTSRTPGRRGRGRDRRQLRREVHDGARQRFTSPVGGGTTVHAALPAVAPDGLAAPSS